MIKQFFIYILYYLKRVFQKCYSIDFTIPYRKRSKVFISNPPGTALKFALETDGNKDLALILSELKTGEIFFDVGANFGLYSLSVFDKFKDTVDIHCFEPETEAFRRLIQNRKINQAPWKCHNFGLGDKEGWLNITSEFGGYNHITKETKGSQQIRILTLDQYIEVSKVQDISVLKIDVEGFELFVLRGAIKSLQNHLIKKIVFEVDDHEKRYGVKESDYSTLLTPCGYKKRSIVGVNFQVWEL